MDLGAFSVSLAVRDLAASQHFYEQLGFEVFGGDAAQHWLMLRNGPHVIGLFEGLFEANILTFNPGLNNAMQEVEPFTDVRELQARLEELGLELGERVDADSSEGPAHITLVDPDGNPILIDQFR